MDRSLGDLHPHADIRERLPPQADHGRALPVAGLGRLAWANPKRGMRRAAQRANCQAVAYRYLFEPIVVRGMRGHGSEVAE